MKQTLQLSAVPRIPRARGKRKKQTGLLPAIQLWLSSALTWLGKQRFGQEKRKLRLCESVSLGEKRFAAVLEYEGRQFLLGGSAQSVNLLAELRTSSFGHALIAERANAPETQ